MSIRKPNPTQAAGILRRILKDAGLQMPHTAALEAVARLEGYSDWQAMAAAQKRTAERNAEMPPLLQPAPDADDNSDFVYVDNAHDKGAWVDVKGISVYIKPTDEGVVVDLFAKGAEDRGSEASTYLFYQEALDALCENLGVEEDAVAEHYGRTTSKDFSQEPPARKMQLVREYARLPQPAITASTVVETTPAPATSAEDDDSSRPRFMHGDWEHIFRTRAEMVRFVFDREKHAIVYMEIRDGHAWRPASHMDIADVQDSLLNANDEALDDPESFGLKESDTPPQWSAAFVRS